MASLAALIASCWLYAAHAYAVALAANDPAPWLPPTLVIVFEVSGYCALLAAGAALDRSRAAAIACVLIGCIAVYVNYSNGADYFTAQTYAKARARAEADPAYMADRDTLRNAKAGLEALNDVPTPADIQEAIAGFIQDRDAARAAGDRVGATRAANQITASRNSLPKSREAVRQRTYYETAISSAKANMRRAETPTKAELNAIAPRVAITELIKALGPFAFAFGVSNTAARRRADPMPTPPAFDLAPPPAQNPAPAPADEAPPPAPAKQHKKRGPKPRRAVTPYADYIDAPPLRMGADEADAIRAKWQARGRDLPPA